MLCHGGPKNVWGRGPKTFKQIKTALSRANPYFHPQDGGYFALLMATIRYAPAPHRTVRIMVCSVMMVVIVVATSVARDVVEQCGRGECPGVSVLQNSNFDQRRTAVIPLHLTGNSK